MSRVLSTEVARDAITRMRSIIEGGFAEEIAQLNAQGQILSEPENWDGPLAVQFRSTWLETQAVLDRAREELVELNMQLDRISNDIFAAGGMA